MDRFEDLLESLIHILPKQGAELKLRAFFAPFILAASNLV